MSGPKRRTGLLGAVIPRPTGIVPRCPKCSNPHNPNEPGWCWGGHVWPDVDPEPTAFQEGWFDRPHRRAAS